MSEDSRGYTFLEITVVLVLIGLFFSLSVPRFRAALLVDDLKSSARRMTSLINSTRSEAATGKKIISLNLDLDSNRYWTVSEGMKEDEATRAREDAFSLPGDIAILDVWSTGKGKKMMGETSIHFSNRGYVRRTVIHLGMDEESGFTLVLDPFLPSVRITKGYVEYEDI